MHSISESPAVALPAADETLAGLAPLTDEERSELVAEVRRQHEGSAFSRKHLDLADSPILRYEATVLALLSERAELRASLAEEKPQSDAQKLKAHLMGCDECSAGDYCDEGERFGGEITHNYLRRITEGNGCTALASLTRVATYRDSRTTPATHGEA